MLNVYLLGILFFAAGSSALYDSSSDVVELTPSNFERLVTNSDEVWIVEFFAPWCGHCKNLVPEYKKAARALKGIVKVGAVDADTHKSLSQKYGVTGFPTIKVFTGSKHTPYQGQRTAEAFVDAALKAAKDKAYDNLGKKPSSGSDKDKRKSTIYGHNIPWRQVKKTSLLKQVQHPNIITSSLDEKKRLDILQQHLFRKTMYNVDSFKIVHTQNKKFLNKF